MNEKKTGDWKMILGGIVLIAVLFAGVKLIFLGLDLVIHQDVQVVLDASSDVSVSQDVTVEPDAPSFCVHCGKALPESFQWGQFCPWCGEKNER